jgi:hypothetical protein
VKKWNFAGMIQLSSSDEPKIKTGNPATNSIYFTPQSERTSLHYCPAKKRLSACKLLFMRYLHAVRRGNDLN